MPRPCKRRRVCLLPERACFRPAEDRPGLRVEMTVEEFEAIRLMDLEGLTQEDCARQMEVSRATVQAIYGGARAKLARFLVRGRELVIGGGAYVLCPGGPGCGRCPAPRREEQQMKTIAVPYEDGQIFQHFGHTEVFKLYALEGGGVVSSALLETGGTGHGALAGLLADQGVDTLICGGIGGGARAALESAGIRIFGGVSGGADQAVADLLSGRLAFDPQAACGHHHGHGEEHGCGRHHGQGEEHGCGGPCG